MTITSPFSGIIKCFKAVEIKDLRHTPDTCNFYSKKKNIIRHKKEKKKFEETLLSVEVHLT